MEAHENSFSFIKTQTFYDVPYFQRSYVWTKENWDELFDNLSGDSSHFLGSVIIKYRHTPSGQIPRSLIIDGQQRLMTLSILLRACYDEKISRLKKDPNNPQLSRIIARLEATVGEFLFVSTSVEDFDPEIKISPSRLDMDSFRKVIKGGLSTVWTESDEDCPVIEQCYLFFKRKLKESDDATLSKIWDVLIGVSPSEHTKILVVINLDPDENEQLIFDTINSAGVRLSSSDTIKNAMYHRFNELLSEDVKKVEATYNETWGKTFEADEDTNQYWKSVKATGRINRDNIEIVLHSIALIKGIFDPDKHKMSELSSLYKNYFSTLNLPQMKDFVKEIMSYSDLYKDYFTNVDSSLSYHDRVHLAIFALEKCQITAFHPYILKLLKEDSEDMESKIWDVSSYVVWHMACKTTAKNFNKECLQIMRGEKSFGELFQSKMETSDNAEQSLRFHLNKLNENALPTLILFCINLYREYNNKLSEMHTTKFDYNYSLEHVLPKNWVENWRNIPVYKDDGTIETDPLIAKAIRDSSVLSIGNMTLLKTALNSTIKNKSFPDKVTSQKGIAKNAYLNITKQDVVEFYNGVNGVHGIWDERRIRVRSDSLIEEFKTIWPMPEIKPPKSIQQKLM